MTLGTLDYHRFWGGTLPERKPARSGRRGPEQMNYKSQQPEARAGRPEYEETTSTGKHGAEARTTSPRMHCSRFAQGPPEYVVVGGGANSYSCNPKEKCKFLQRPTNVTSNPLARSPGAP